MSDERKELLPCPFCGSSARFVYAFRGAVRLSCINPDCVVHIPVMDTDGQRKLAAKAWNRRVSVPQGAQEGETGDAERHNDELNRLSGPGIRKA